MEICEISFNKVVEWFENDLLIRKLTNRNVNLILHHAWKKSEKRGVIHYGDIRVDFLKDFFKFEITSYRPERTALYKNTYNELNIKCVVENQIIADMCLAKNVSYDMLEFIIKFLQFI